MNILRYFTKYIEGEIVPDILSQIQLQNPPSAYAGTDSIRISCEVPQNSAHGDIATNAAMVLSKWAGMPPRELANKYIIEKLQDHPFIESAQVAGPGFINMTLYDAFWHARLQDILSAGDAWGDSDIGDGQRIIIEFVSANPTGPLHAAHARGAIIGDSLANLLKKAGFDVSREYYINDAGGQVDTLAESAYLRYREALGEAITLPDGLYPGAYLKEIGRGLVTIHGDTLMTAPKEEWLPLIRQFTTDAMMHNIKGDLDRLNITIDVFSSEKQLVENGAVDVAVEKLTADGLMYQGILAPPKGKAPDDDWEPREQMLFRATDFGDDSDRPIQKSDGSWTYFANDIAYHWDKLQRVGEGGLLINIWGADHVGYVNRMKIALEALSGEQGLLDIQLCQLVTVTDEHGPIKMSKRAGTFVALTDVLDSVGKDILRFIMLTRRHDQAMDFDYAKVIEQSRDNPVFYVQYAHARTCSVLRQAGERTGERIGEGANLSLLTDDAEIKLIRLMAGWPRVVEAAAASREPHRIAFFLNDLAAAFHALWNKGRDNPQCRFILENNPALTDARLALVYATGLVIRSGLAILGVTAVEEM